MSTVTTITEADILEEVLSGTLADLHPDAARSLLNFKFEPKTTRRIRQLLQKNNRGTISAEERIILEKYLRVGLFLDLLTFGQHLPRLRLLQRSQGNQRSRL